MEHVGYTCVQCVIKPRLKQFNLVYVNEFYYLLA